MSDNKKYYYLKLKDNFFDSDSIVILESMPDGYLYSNILLKLYLRSLKSDGKLLFNDRIPYNPTMLSQLTRHNVGVVEKALQIFSELDLIEILDNGAIYMLDIQNYIGNSSTEADRIRNYRNTIKQEKQSVQMLQQMYDKSTPEIEIEKEIEKEIEIELEKRVKSTKEKKAKTSFSQTDYIKAQNFSPYLEEKLIEWLEYKKERRETYKETGLKALCTQIKNRLIEFSDIAICNLIDECMANGWRGIIWDRIKNQTAKKESGNVFLDIAMDGDIL